MTRGLAGWIPERPAPGVAGLVLALAAIGCTEAASEPEPAATTGDTSVMAGTGSGSVSDDDDTAAPASSTDTSSGGSTDTDTEAPFLEICDGSDTLRLVARTGGPESDCPDAGLTLTGLYAMLGDTYLYVRGDCRYWVIDSLLTTPGAARTGVLDQSQAAALSEDLGYGSWAELDGSYGAQCRRTLSNLRSTIACGDSCYWGSWAPPELPLWLDAARSWRAILYESGEPVPLTDPLRLDGWIADADPEQALDGIPPWPFAFTPANVGIPPYVPGRQATWAVTDPVVASALRSHWMSLEGPAPDHVHSLSFHVPGDPVRIVTLWLRDAVPFENAEGYVPVPEPPMVPLPD